jgi:hypothetical protein
LSFQHQKIAFSFRNTIWTIAQLTKLFYRLNCNDTRIHLGHRIFIGIYGKHETIKKLNFLQDECLENAMKTYNEKLQSK